MKINRLQIERYKNIRSCDIEFTQSPLINAVIGSNGSGKSNLIEAIIQILIGCYFEKAPPFEFRLEFEAQILATECLDDGQAEQALNEFKKRGWHQTMLQEIQAAGGNPSALGDAEWAKHVLNIRFRLENVRWFPAETFAASDDPIFKLNRYSLNDREAFEQKTATGTPHRKGSLTPPPIQPFVRRAAPAVECTPEHAKIQAKLLADLKKEFPNARIVLEEDYIDVSVRTDKELVLFEIKSDLEPRTVIRQALGQILEYAYHPNRKHTLPLSLVIVGRRELTAVDRAYLDRLKADFCLPLQYRSVSI